MSVAVARVLLSSLSHTCVALGTAPHARHVLDPPHVHAAVGAARRHLVVLVARRARQDAAALRRVRHTRAERHVLLQPPAVPHLHRAVVRRRRHERRRLRHRQRPHRPPMLLQTMDQVIHASHAHHSQPCAQKHHPPREPRHVRGFNRLTLSSHVGGVPRMLFGRRLNRHDVVKTVRSHSY